MANVTPDLTNNDKAVLVELLRQTIACAPLPAGAADCAASKRSWRSWTRQHATGAIAGTKAAGRAQHGAGEEAAVIENQKS